MSGEGRESAEKLRTVHNLDPMTTKQLADLRCGHCRHRLTMHASYEGKRGLVTHCGICHCLRSPGEDILQPHNFRPSDVRSSPGQATSDA